MGEKLYLNLVNNTSAPQQVSLFNSTFNEALNPSATDTQNQYIWDVTSFSFTSEQTVRVQYQLIGASTFTNATASVLTASIDGVVTALNTLNIGTFYSYTSGGSTFIAIYSQTYAYQNLRIFDITQLEIPYTFNVPTVTGTINIGNQFVPPSLTVSLPNTSSSGTLYLNTTFVINNDGGLSSTVNYTITVNGVLTVTDFFNFVPVIRTYSYSGGDLVSISFYE